VIDVVGALPSTIRESKRGFDMNWARGLFRSWLVAASLWCSIIGVISYLEYGSHESAIATSTASLLILVPPAALFVLAYALLWVARGFRRDQPAQG
jgi:hypothetical protein